MLSVLSAKHHVCERDKSGMKVWEGNLASAVLFFLKLAFCFFFLSPTTAFDT